MCDHRNPERGPMFQLRTYRKMNDDDDDDILIFTFLDGRREEEIFCAAW
jgi:hypothetical protein